MEEKRHLIIELLSAAIRNRKIEYLEHGSQVDWKDIFDEAKAHGIHTLIYPALKTLKEPVSEDLMRKWQKTVFIQSMSQLRFLEEVRKVLLRLHESGIKVIALKGLVLRELYPYPELRSMSDADLLIQKRDMDSAKAILAGSGFVEKSENPEHIEFLNANGMKIELHSSLIGEGRFRKEVKLEETVWKNAVKSDVLSIPALCLNPEDHLLYLGLHMAKHFIHVGFGLRQCCDFALLVESIREKTDWDSFFGRLERYGVQRFFSLLFLTCEQLFSICPPGLNALGIKSSKYTELFIKEIFDSGLYGNKNPSRTMQSYILRKVESGKSALCTGKIRYFRELFFPPAHHLSEQYRYAVRYPFLLPAAWIHRMARSLFSREIPIKDKLSFSGSFGTRAELMGWLHLR